MKDTEGHNKKQKVPDPVFLDNQTKLHKELNNFFKTKADFTPYYENMKEMDTWLKKGENSGNS